MKPLSRRPCGALLLAALGAGCAAPSGHNHRREALRALEFANYEVAYEQSRRALAAAPGDARMQRFANDVRILWLVHSGRELLFLGKHAQALELFERVLTLDPENRVAKAWKAKARSAAAKVLIDEGQELLKADKLEDAFKTFQKALTYAPGNPAAMAGLRDVSRIYKNKRSDASRHYRSALGAREESDWERVHYYAGKARDNDPTFSGTPELLVASGRRVAERQRAWAESLEDKGLWGAARKAWMRAEQLATEAKLAWVADAKKKIEELGNESRAQRLFDKAEVRIASGRFDAARKLIAEADPLCTQDRVFLNELLAEIDRREIEALYADAHLLEIDYRYEQALDAYSELQDRDPDGPAAGKVETIAEMLATCAVQYEEARDAAKAGALDRARGLWKDILAVHPRYKDVRKLYAEAAKSKSP